MAGREQQDRSGPHRSGSAGAVAASFPPFLEPLGRARDLAHARVVVLPAPLEMTVSWLPGTGRGPEAICAASHTLELFDDELLQETWKVGIVTHERLAFPAGGPAAAVATVEAAVAEILGLPPLDGRRRLPVVLGGEHTVTVGAVRACSRAYPGLHVLQVDAHLDLRDTYEGSPYSHACVMRRVADMGLGFTQVGIRSIASEEWELVCRRGWQPYTMQRIRGQEGWIEAVAAAIAGPVYLTIDVDGLDPAVIPATGTPEPGGLDWFQVTGLIRAVAARSPIVGIDCVELAPRPGLEHAAYAAAKLVYRAIGCAVAQDLSTTTGNHQCTT